MPNVVRGATALAIAMGVTTACSTPPQTAAVPAGSPGGSPAGSPVGSQAGSTVPMPVAARILPPFQGHIVFDVNQPTYVAVFDVRPFIGIEMIYPGPDDEGRAIGGVQVVSPYYLVQANEERRAQATPFVGGGEDYLYLLASRVPLHLEAFANHPILLSDSAGVSLKRLPPYEQIDSLMRNIVQPLYDNDWDADILILSPGPDPSVNESQLALDCGIDHAVSNKICAHQTHVVPTALLGPGAGTGAASGQEEWRVRAERAENQYSTEGTRAHESSRPAMSRTSSTNMHAGNMNGAVVSSTGAVSHAAAGTGGAAPVAAAGGAVSAGGGGKP